MRFHYSWKDFEEIPPLVNSGCTRRSHVKSRRVSGSSATTLRASRQRQRTMKTSNISQRLLWTRPYPRHPTYCSRPSRCFPLSKQQTLPAITKPLVRVTRNLRYCRPGPCCATRNVVHLHWHSSSLRTRTYSSALAFALHSRCAFICVAVAVALVCSTYRLHSPQAFASFICIRFLHSLFALTSRS